MIRILDRYLLNTFLASLLVFALAFGTLFLVVDFASKLGKFLEIKSIPPLLFMARYYGVRLPMVLSYLLPTVILFASIFTVTRLARANEILPIAASGTSLRRMALPFLLAAAMASLVMAATDEFVLSRLADEIAETDDILDARETSYGVEDYDGWTKLYAHQYDHVRKTLGSVQITRLDAEARPVEHVRAKTCRWDPARRRWVAYEGTVEFPDQIVTPEAGRPQVRKEPIGPEGYAVTAPFTPETLRKGSSLINLLPFAPMSKLLEEARKFPHIPSCVMKVHARFSFPLSPILLLLLGLPFVIAAHSRSFLKGLFFCFLVAVAYYLAHFACMMMGYQGHLPPVLAAWTPTAVFGTAGLASFARMRT
jgi:lipopolysaccharide export system permease protein